MLKTEPWTVLGEGVSVVTEQHYTCIFMSKPWYSQGKVN